MSSEFQPYHKVLTGRINFFAAKEMRLRDLRPGDLDVIEELVLMAATVEIPLAAHRIQVSAALNALMTKMQQGPSFRRIQKVIDKIQNAMDALNEQAYDQLRSAAEAN